MLHVNFRVGHLFWEDKLSTFGLLLAKYIEFHKIQTSFCCNKNFVSKVPFPVCTRSHYVHIGLEGISQGGSVGQALHHTGDQSSHASLIAQRQNKSLMIDSC